jgi:hypothetical protein
MKKSQAFKMAQLAVLANERISAYDKLEVLKVLMDEEHIALICEKDEEEENG